MSLAGFAVEFQGILTDVEMISDRLEDRLEAEQAYFLAGRALEVVTDESRDEYERLGYAEAAQAALVKWAPHIVKRAT